MNIRNSIWIGRSKIRNIRRTRNTIFTGTREAGAARIKFVQQVIRSIYYVQSDSHLIMFSRFFIAVLNPLYRNINSTTILVHRTTVHMWRWFHGLVFLILTRNTIFAGTRKAGVTNNFAQQAIYRSTHVQPTGSDPYQVWLPVFSAQAYRNIHSITILVHRTAHMWNWKWFHGLWRKKAALRMWTNRNQLPGVWPSLGRVNSFRTCVLACFLLLRRFNTSQNLIFRVPFVFSRKYGQLVM